MAQDDILDILKQDPNKWFTIFELSEILKITTNSITNNLKKLRKYDLVDSKKERHPGYQTATWLHKLKN